MCITRTPREVTRPEKLFGIEVDLVVWTVEIVVIPVWEIRVDLIRWIDIILAFVSGGMKN